MKVARAVSQLSDTAKYVFVFFDLNQGRADGKWDQAADLALQPQDIAPGWILQPGVGTPPRP